MKMKPKEQIKRYSNQKYREKSPFMAVTVAVLNVVLLVITIILYGCYTDAYSKRLQEENLDNIANMNQSAANNMTALIDSWNIKLEDTIQYASRHDCTLDEALAYIEDANSSDERYFELIGSDYTGYLACLDEKGEFIPVSYQGHSYEELQKAFDRDEEAGQLTASFAPEFTDDMTALKHFALYCHLPLADGVGGQEWYTLMLAAKSSDVLAVFNSQIDFEGQSTVLVEEDGNYIVSNDDFKSTNFFQYLYVYNDLTLDERKAIEQEVLGQDSGELYYKNAVGQDCVFCYSRIEEHNWYCITCVPITSFRTPVSGVNYAVYAVVALLLLAIIDVTWLYYMNRRLHFSMVREKEASEAKTDFLSRMSHDIRTPLNGIIGLTTLAMDEPNPSGTQEYLERIQVSGQFLLGLVNDILDMNKVESGKIELHPEPYSDREFSSYIEAIILPLCDEKGLEFRMTTPSDDMPVRLDRLRFNQIFFNLLSNGVKYTPEGGMLELY